MIEMSNIWEFQPRMSLFCLKFPFDESFSHVDFSVELTSQCLHTLGFSFHIEPYLIVKEFIFGPAVGPEKDRCLRLLVRARYVQVG